jgi:hypothetical protein
MSKRIVLILWVTTLTIVALSCSYPSYLIEARFLTLDDPNDNLEIEFNFRLVNDPDSSSFRVNYIHILKDGSTLYRLRLQSSEGIKKYTFPSVPQNFIVEYPPGIDSIREFSKNEKIDFYFGGEQRGRWHYKPSFSRSDHRWLFDKNYRYINLITAEYTTWRGNDFIYIELNQEVEIHENSFRLIHKDSTEIGNELVLKSNPTNKLALELNGGLPKHTDFYLLVSNDIVNSDVSTEEYHKLSLNVGNKSSIGLVGKYRDL